MYFLQNRVKLLTCTPTVTIKRGQSEYIYIYELPRHDPQRRTYGRGPGGIKHNGGWLCSVIVRGSESQDSICQSGRSIDRSSSPAESQCMHDCIPTQDCHRRQGSRCPTRQRSRPAGPGPGPTRSQADR